MFIYHLNKDDNIHKQRITQNITDKEISKAYWMLRKTENLIMISLSTKYDQKHQRYGEKKSFVGAE